MNTLTQVPIRQVVVGFSAEYSAGLPTGNLSFHDRGSDTKLQAASIDTFVVDPSGTSATFTGKATVNGTPNVAFTVKVEDLGEPGTADTFTITWPGYLASGVLLKGNVQVERR